jgi:hypothetical protein
MLPNPSVAAQQVPTRVLSHPHFIQRICKFVNPDGSLRTAVKLSHVNRAWEETLWHYQTLHTVFWKKILAEPPARFGAVDFKECHTFLQRNFQSIKDQQDGNYFRGTYAFDHPSDEAALQFVLLLRKFDAFAEKGAERTVATQSQLVDSFVTLCRRWTAKPYKPESACKNLSAFQGWTVHSPLVRLFNNLISWSNNYELPDDPTMIINEGHERLLFEGLLPYHLEPSLDIRLHERQARSYQTSEVGKLSVVESLLLDYILLHLTSSSAPAAANRRLFVISALARAHFAYHGAMTENNDWNPLTECINWNDAESFNIILDARVEETKRKEIRQQIQLLLKHKVAEHNHHKNKSKKNDDDDHDHDKSDSNNVQAEVDRLQAVLDSPNFNQEELNKLKHTIVAKLNFKKDQKEKFCPGFV